MVYGEHLSFSKWQDPSSRLQELASIFIFLRSFMCCSQHAGLTSNCGTLLHSTSTIRRVTFSKRCWFVLRILSSISVLIDLISLSAWCTVQMKYSVILPTYNEKRNLPLIISMLNKSFTEKLVVRPTAYLLQITLDLLSPIHP